MKSLHSIVMASACLAVLCPGSLLTAQTAPDNSGHNSHQGKTADDQHDAKADRLTSAKIRRAIVADKDLSTYAHNVKIITMNGSVTLKGPVRSEEEKQKVAADTAAVVTADKVDNQLTVKQ